MLNYRGEARSAVDEKMAQGSRLPEEIVQALVNGDVKTLGRFFDASVDLSLNSNQGVYAKSQAEQILKTFFSDNAPAGGKFTYKHLTSYNKDNVQYYIGELHTGKGLYRLTVFMKDKSIHRMRIESNE